MRSARMVDGVIVLWPCLNIDEEFYFITEAHVHQVDLVSIDNEIIDGHGMCGKIKHHKAT